jgi:hypothetical protein
MTATEERAEELDYSIVYIEKGLKVIVPSTARYRPSISRRYENCRTGTHDSDIYAQNNIKTRSFSNSPPIDAVNAS